MWVKGHPFTDVLYNVQTRAEEMKRIFLPDLTRNLICDSLLYYNNGKMVSVWENVVEK